MNFFKSNVNYSCIFYSIPALFCVIGAYVLNFINLTAPSPYIDEIFHIGQCQKYCDGNFFTYDPKLTTPPGLYVITLIFLTPALKLINLKCSVELLRFVNFVASFSLFILIYYLLKIQIYQNSNIKKLFIAVNLSTLPVLYFFSFFYYTDVVSTITVLLTYYFYHLNYSHAAGLTGLLSVTLRQTNLIWFFCFASIKCCKNIENEMDRINRSITEANRRKLSYTWVVIKECWNLIQRRSFFYLFKIVLKETYLFIVTVIAFIYLIIKNGSLVLGDKSAHTAVIHLPQLFYFSLFTSIFSFPFCIYPSLKFLANFRRLYKHILIATMLMILVVTFNTMAHLYLISDNRHYTFYIWKRIFQRSYGKYLVIPTYIISIYCMIENTSHIDGYTKVGYLISSFVVLVPQKLLEFRYFIIPYLLYRIATYHHIKWWQICLELSFNIIINFLTVLLFINFPFQWPDGTTQRFSW